ncbi:MAG: DAK2 domain-containing protein [Actinomycetes bacterium]
MGDATIPRPGAPGADAAWLRALVTAYRDLLVVHRADLNRLNVYPVPDGDTGTNMSLTLDSVVSEVSEVSEVSDDLAGVCRAVAHGSLMGARGNSGVILSQILRGLADEVGAAPRAGVSSVVAGLRTGADAAYAAVMHPVEGTILTVAREAAAAATEAAEAGGDLIGVLDAAARVAHETVARTPEMLPALAQAGVVDAGGRGLALMFDAWLHVCDGRALPEPGVVVDAEPGSDGTRPAPVEGPRYEVMFLLEAPDDAIPGFRATWDALGESIVVVGGEGTWNCHVHTDDIGAAIEAGVVAGRPVRIEVTDLHDQVQAREQGWVAAATAAVDVRECAVVTVATGDGVIDLFTSLGVAVVVPGGQSMNPSTQQILDAVHASGGTSVVVLPNNKNIVAVAEQAAALADRPVAVVPTRSVVEGLAAMIEYDATLASAANAGAMAGEVARVRTAEVTRAVRDSAAACGPIAVGDWIAITREGICAAASSPVDAALVAVEQIVEPDCELVTVLVGADASPGDAELLRERIAAAHPDLVIEVHDGGQPLYPFLVGVE